MGRRNLIADQWSYAEMLGEYETRSLSVKKNIPLTLLHSAVLAQVSIVCVTRAKSILIHRSLLLIEICKHVPRPSKEIVIKIELNLEDSQV